MSIKILKRKTPFPKNFFEEKPTLDMSPTDVFSVEGSSKN